MSSQIKTLRRLVDRGYVSLIKNDDGSYTVRRDLPEYKFKAAWFWLEVWIGTNRRRLSGNGRYVEEFEIKPEWLTLDRRRSLENLLIKRDVLL